MSRSLGWIRQFHRPPAAEAEHSHRPPATEAGHTQQRPLLIVFPHAGGGASSYRTFSKALSSDFEVLLLQYPGRQDRMREALPPSLPAFAAEAFAEFAESPWAEREIAGLFGHSMGALVAFEFARIVEAKGLTVGRLFAAATAAPWRRGQLPPHPQNDDEILTRLAAMNGTAAEVMLSDELMRMALPAIKKDYELIDAYTCPRETRLAATIHLLGGADDVDVLKSDLLAWADHTEQTLALDEFPGGHFFVDANLEAIAATMRSSLQLAQARA